MDRVVRPVNAVAFPAMRREVMTALACLADTDYQVDAWLEKNFPSASYYDDLTMNIHTLYDDSQVLPSPESRIGTVLVAGAEVARLGELDVVLGALIADHGEAPDVAYIEDPRWPVVVTRAAGCLAAMVRAGGLD